MKTEVQEVIDEMTDIITCTLDVPARKYTDRSQLQKAIKDLEGLAKEVTDFVVEGYNTSNWTGAPFFVFMVTMN